MMKGAQHSIQLPLASLSFLSTYSSLLFSPIFSFFSSHLFSLYAKLINRRLQPVYMQAYNLKVASALHVICSPQLGL